MGHALHARRPHFGLLGRTECFRRIYQIPGHGPRRHPLQGLVNLATRSLHKIASRGFTIIELMIVISIILILVSVALPAYNQSILRARESVLRQNLFTMRSVISQYTLD